MNKQSFKPIDPKPDFAKLEEEVLKFWEDNQIFEKSLEQTKDGEPYTFYDGPPFATGTPHYGHILASTVKDLIPRYQTMKGRFVRRRWGWDCHGLPIEELVERKLGISGKKDIEKLGIQKFNETCRSMVMEYVGEWRKTIRRIARWIDFDHSYKTMDRDYMESVWWAFKQIYDKGLVYEGRRVLLYCPRCETPISNFEVAMDNSYKDVTEEAVTVKFQITNNKFQNTYLLAWTTTPWTLPGNVALAVGEDIEYVKVKLENHESGIMNHEFYILAKDRVADVFKSFPDSRFSILDSSLKGSDLVGLEYEPLFDVPALKTSPSPSLKGGEYRVYPADFVNTEEGTGIVHTAVVYGEDDYNLGLKVGLPVVPLLDEKGMFNAKSPELIRGMYFKDSEKLIKKDLEARGLMFAKNQHQHSYPHCWRCGTMLFYNAIPAWFMNIQKIKDGLLKTNALEINWYPEHLKHGRYQKSVEAAPDWNISRNRYWGNPIPVWKCDDKNCDGVKVVGSIKDLGLSKNTFYFVRHGEARQNLLNINSCYPEKEVYDLTETGVKEAEQGVKELKTLGGVDLIFSSDILRTKRTAEVYGKILGVEVKVDKRLREFDFGIYNGHPSSDWYKKDQNLWEEGPEGGENWADIKVRIVEFINEVNERYKGKRILVASHGDPLWVLMQHFGSELSYPKFANPFELDVSAVDLHRPYIDEVVLKCPKCGKSAHRISEIFDSWVEAGSMPFAEYHYPFDQKEIFESRFPGQFVAEYIAQTRAWFYVMHVISYNLFGHAPFENVVTTGTIQAEDGSKMSKSKNNFPDPWKVMEQYGVDALRFYLMNSVVMQADNLDFSERELGIVYRKNILILWNIFNYFVTYANEANWEPKEGSLETEPKSVLDQWAWARTQELVNETAKQLDNYNTVRYTRAIEEYINDLSTWYLRRSRGRKDDEFFLTLRHCLIVVAKVSAPVMPYLSEIIYRELNWVKELPSVHLTSWNKIRDISSKQKNVLEQIQLVRDMVENGHSLRKAASLKLRQPLAGVSYTAAKQLEKEYEEVLADELNVKLVVFKSEKLPDNTPFVLSFDTNITPELKKEGLAREIERLVQDLRKQSGLKVGELANLSYDTEDEELKSAFELFDTKKTYIREIKQESGGQAFEIEGKKMSIKKLG
jgi:isoleucyl-tRNA synthetase